MFGIGPLEIVLLGMALFVWQIVRTRAVLRFGLRDLILATTFLAILLGIAVLTTRQ
jgi:hypothetical protein